MQEKDGEQYYCSLSKKRCKYLWYCTEKGTYLTTKCKKCPAYKPDAK